MDAFVFDLDDTLYLERDYCYSGLAAVAAAFEDRLGGREAAERALREAFASGDRRRVFDIALKRLGVASEGLLTQLIACYRNHTPRISPCDDVFRALDRVKAAARIGLITDGAAAGQRAKLAALGLAPFFDHVVFTDDWGPAWWKPHPRAFEHLAGALGVSHRRCVFVADNPRKDFLAPNELGWMTVRIARPGGIYADATAPPGGAAQRVIRSLDELSA